MTWIDQCMSEKKFSTRRNLFVLQYKKIDKVEIFDALHDKIAMRRREKWEDALSGEQEIVSKQSLDHTATYISLLYFSISIETEEAFFIYIIYIYIVFWWLW